MQTGAGIRRFIGRKIFDVPVGFKWFVEGLLDGSLAFVGEESAGATFVRMDGKVWTTDKDGMIPGLLAAEMTVKTGRDPEVIYQELTQEFGVSYFKRIDASATKQQKSILKKLSIIKGSLLRSRSQRKRNLKICICFPKPALPKSGTTRGMRSMMNSIIKKHDHSGAGEYCPGPVSLF